MSKSLRQHQGVLTLLQAAIGVTVTACVCFYSHERQHFNWVRRQSVARLALIAYIEIKTIVKWIWLWALKVRARRDAFKHTMQTARILQLLQPVQLVQPVELLELLLPQLTYILCIYANCNGPNPNFNCGRATCNAPSQTFSLTRPSVLLSCIACCSICRL